MAVVLGPNDEELVFDPWGPEDSQWVPRSEYEMREALRADPTSGFFAAERFGGFAPQQQAIRNDLAAQNYDESRDIFEPVNVMGSEVLGPEPGVGVNDPAASEFAKYIGALSRGIFGFGTAVGDLTARAPALQEAENINQMQGAGFQPYTQDMVRGWEEAQNIRALQPEGAPSASRSEMELAARLKAGMLSDLERRLLAENPDLARRVRILAGMAEEAPASLLGGLIGAIPSVGEIAGAPLALGARLSDVIGYGSAAEAQRRGARAIQETLDTPIPESIRRPAVQGLSYLLSASPGTAALSLIGRRTVGVDPSRLMAEVVLPTTVGEAGLELIPGVGFAPDILRGAARAAPDIGRAMTRGLDEAAPLGRLLGEEMGAARVPGEPQAGADREHIARLISGLPDEGLDNLARQTVAQMRAQGILLPKRDVVAIVNAEKARRGAAAVPPLPPPAAAAPPVQPPAAVMPSRAEPGPPAVPPPERPAPPRRPPPGGPAGVPPPREPRAPDPAEALDGVIPAGRGGRLLGGGETEFDAAIRQYEGAVNTAARTEINNWKAMQGKLRQAGITPGADTPEVRGLFKALHGEAPVPPQFQEIYDDLKRLLAEEEALSVDFDPRFALHPDYFPRFWEEPKTTAPGPRGLGSKPGFIKPRVDATFTELLEAGYVPRSWDPAAMVAMRRMAGAEYREQQKLLTLLKERGLAVDMVGPIPDGWRMPDTNGPAFRGKPYVDASGEIRFTPPQIVPNPVANVLEQMFGRKLNWGTVGKLDVHSAVRQAFNAPKRVKLLGSLFQQIDFAARTAWNSIGGALDAVVAGKPMAALKNVIKLPADIGSLVAANLSPSWRQRLSETLVSERPIVKARPGVTWNLVSKQGLSTGDYTVFNNSVRDALSSAAANAKAGRPRRIVNAINGAMERGLFEGVYPQAQKMAIENFWAPAIIRAHPDWTDAQIAASIATEANKAFSSLGRSQTALRHINRNLTEVAHMVVFSTNETESILKQAASTFIGPNRRQWAEYWAGGILFTAALAETIHYAVTGEPLPQDRLLPVKRGGPLGVQYNTRWLAPDVAEKLGRGGTNLSLDLLMQMDTALRLLDPVAFAKVRENVVIRAIHNQVAGKDFFGRPIDSVKERIGQAISDLLVPIPGQQLTGLAIKTFPALEDWIADQEARLGTTAQLIQTTGLNLRAETNQQIRDRMARESGLADTWDELTERQQRQLESDPRNRGLVEELRRRGAEAAKTGNPLAKAQIEAEDIRRAAEWGAGGARSIDVQVASGAMSKPDAREAYKRLEEKLAADTAALYDRPEVKEALKRIPDDGSTEAEKAQKEYFAIFDKPGVRRADGSLDFDAYNRELAEWQARWPQFSKEDVSPSRPLSPGHEEYKQAAKRIAETGYWDAEAKAFDLLRRAANEPNATPQQRLVAKFKSVEDMETQLRQAGFTDNEIVNLKRSLGLQPLTELFRRAAVKKDPRIAIDYLWYGTPPRYVIEAALEAEGVAVP